MAILVPSVIRVDVPALDRFTAALDRFTALGEKCLAYLKEQDALDTSNQEAQKSLDESNKTLEQSVNELEKVERENT